MKNSTRNSLLSPARLCWKDGLPTSESFNDIYFSTDDGFAETQYVFLEGNRLKERWKEFSSKTAQSFTIIETGFGTGLNFMAAWDEWEKVTSPSCRLNYVSVEKHPLQKSDIQLALNAWPQLQGKVTELCNAYPPSIYGFHRISLAEGRVQLTLVWGDILEALPSLHAKADAWFLDGFAPSKNPDMWAAPLFQQMRRLSHKSTTVSTFTAASTVRKNLIAAGFKVEKRKGYKYKREMLTGIFECHQSCSHFKSTQKPWFANNITVSPSGKRAVVIGGGIAGATSAFALAQRGFQVELIERAEKLASAASGNPTGTLFTKLNPEFSPQTHFYQLSYFHAIRHMNALSANQAAATLLQWEQCGLLQLNYSEKENLLQQEIVSSRKWARDVVQDMTPEQASEISGIPQTGGGLFLPMSGWVDPASLCNALLYDKDAIHVRFNQKAMRLSQDSTNKWNISNECGQHITSADIVVIANSADALAFSQSDHLPLKTVRGQISLVPGTQESSMLKTLVNYDGATTPSRNGYHSVGATFQPDDLCEKIREQDHHSNLEQLNRACPNLYNKLNGKNHTNIKGRTAFRCQTPDYLPVVGPLPRVDQYLLDYAGLRTGRLKAPYPTGSFHQGLYINTAYGSRGLTSAPLCSDILLSHITGDPQPIEGDTVHALHPARFIIRDLKQRKR